VDAVGAALLFAGSLALIPKIGFSLFPRPHPAVPRHGAGAGRGEPRRDDRAARFAEGVLRRHAEIVSVAANVGEGNPQIYYNVVPQNRAPTSPSCSARSTGSTRALAAVLRAAARRARRLPRRAHRAARARAGPPLDAPIALRIIGDDFDELGRIAAELEAILRQTPGTRDVDNPSKQRKIDLRVAIDRARAGSLGVQLLDVDRSVRLGVSGIVAGAYHEPGVSDQRATST